MRENFLQRRVIKPLVKLLRQGVTPEKLALSLALSVTLAVIPAFGWSVWLWDVIKLRWNTTWHAVVVWALLAPFAIGLIYLVLLPIFRRVVKGQTAVPPAAEASVA